MAEQTTPTPNKVTSNSWPVANRWTDERAERALGAVQHRIRRHKIMTQVGVGIGLSAAMMLVALSLFSSGISESTVPSPSPSPQPFPMASVTAEPPPSPPASSPASSPASPPAQAPTAELGQTPSAAKVGTQQIVLRDGSRIALMNKTSRVSALIDEPRQVLVRFEAGSARFQVSKREDRRVFEVQTEHVVLKVLGTEFTVSQERHRTRVDIHEGTVSAVSANGVTMLSAGSSKWFSHEPRPARRKRTAVWRKLAQEKDYRSAYEEMKKSPHLVSDTVEDLLLATEAARRSGHLEEALPFLDRIIEQHRGDARVALAAFTKGRLLTRLARFREAANAFSTAETTSREPWLAEAALAHRAQATFQMGDRQAARDLATSYLERYPSGRLVLEMQTIVDHHNAEP